MWETRCNLCAWLKVYHTKEIKEEENSISDIELYITKSMSGNEERIKTDRQGWKYGVAMEKLKFEEKKQIGWGTLAGIYLQHMGCCNRGTTKQALL